MESKTVGEIREILKNLPDGVALSISLEEDEEDADKEDADKEDGECHTD